MDYANKKIYPHFTEVQHYLEQAKEYCSRKGFKPEAVMKLDGSEIFDVVASDTFGIDIQNSWFDKRKKLLIVGGVTTSRTISKYIDADGQSLEAGANGNIVVTSMYHRFNINAENPAKIITPHFTGNNLYNEEHIVFPWQIWSSMREDMKNGLSAFSPNYYESAPDIVVNPGTPEEVTKCLIPWQNIELLCEEVYQYLKTTGKKPDAVFGPARGGHIYAQALSDYLGIPWAANLWHNMIYVGHLFDSGRTAEKVDDFRNIITVAMNYRGGKSSVMPEISLGHDQRLTCNPHERYQHGFTSGVVQTHNNEQFAKALAEARRQRIEERGK